MLRPKQNRRNRNQLDPAVPPRRTDAGYTLAIVATKLHVLLNTRISLRGIPQFLVNGVAPTSAVLIDPYTLELDYLANVVVGQTWSVQYRDPAIKTESGGFLNPGSGTFPA